MLDETTESWDMYNEEPCDDDDDIEVLQNAKIIAVRDKAVLISYKNKQAWFPKVTLYDQNEECIAYFDWFKPKWIINKMKSIEGDFV